MSSTPPTAWMVCVGETAGAVWRTLELSGPMSLSKLVKAVGQPRDALMLALGWLAREDKIDIQENGRSRLVSLR